MAIVLSWTQNTCEFTHCGLWHNSSSIDSKTNWTYQDWYWRRNLHSIIFRKYSRNYILKIKTKPNSPHLHTEFHAKKEGKQSVVTAVKKRFKEIYHHTNRFTINGSSLNYHPQQKQQHWSCLSLWLCPSRTLVPLSNKQPITTPSPAAITVSNWRWYCRHIVWTDRPLNRTPPTDARN